MQRRNVEEEEAEPSSLSTLSAVPDEGPAAHRTDCATAELPTGLPARTKREVMEKSKADKQYGMGITETGMDKPGNLVDSAAYWESRCTLNCLSCYYVEFDDERTRPILSISTA